MLTQHYRMSNSKLRYLNLEFKPQGSPKIMGNTNAFLKSLAHLTVYTTRHSDIRDRLKVTPINGQKDTKKLTKERNKNGSSPLLSVGGIPLLKMRLGTTKAMTDRQRSSLDLEE